MERVFVTGCNGLLGQKLLQRFDGRYELIGGDIHPEPFLANLPFTYHQLDITNKRQLVKTVAEAAPAFVLNAAAFTDVDGAETQKELCWKINVTGVENLASACRKAESHLVHVSTDYIFDGKSGPYSEDATPNPIGYYGKSKLAGENILLSSEIDWTITRTTVLYGAGQNLRLNFATWLVQQLQAKKQVKIVDDQVGNSTIVEDLANGIFAVVQQKKTGIYNMSGADILSRLDFSYLLAEVFNLDKSLISAIKTADLNQKAPRPLNSGFILQKAKSELNLDFMTTRESLELLKKQLQNGVNG